MLRPETLLQGVDEEDGELGRALDADGEDALDVGGAAGAGEEQAVAGLSEKQRQS